MELCSMLCGSLDGTGVRGIMDTCICMAESLCCPPETINIVTPILNKNTRKKNSVLLFMFESLAPKTS